MQTYLLIGLGGIAGANARYLISVWAADRWGPDFPYGTLIINITGSLLLGLFLTLVAGFFDNSAQARYLVATGFLSAYTTFSTFAYETSALVRQGSYRHVFANGLGSVALGVVGAAAGILLGNLWVTTF